MRRSGCGAGGCCSAPRPGPGWAATAMGGPNAPVRPQHSVAGLRQVIAGLTPEKSGRFWQWDGKELPW